MLSSDKNSRRARAGEHSAEIPAHRASAYDCNSRPFSSFAHELTSRYFCSAVGDEEAARSEFHMSTRHFQFPSACCSQTSRYLPRSLTGLPLTSFIVSSYIPLTHAVSPDLPTCTLVGFQVITRP